MPIESLLRDPEESPLSASVWVREAGSLFSFGGICFERGFSNADGLFARGLGNGLNSMVPAERNLLHIARALGFLAGVFGEPKRNRIADQKAYRSAFLRRDRSQVAHGAFGDFDGRANH